MNLIQMQDRLRGLPDSALQTAASQPGQYQFLALAEMAERQKVRGAYAQEAQAAAPTVAQRIMGGNDVPEVQSPRMDIGGLAAASNRGDMQPAIGMNQGGLVTAAIGMQAGGPTPTADVPEGYQRMADGSVREIEKVKVLAQRAKPKETEAAEIDPYNWFNKLAGAGPFKGSGGLMDPFRQGVQYLTDQYSQKVKDAAPVDRVAPMLAAQAQDRARNAELEKRDRWLALAQAGLSAAANASPDFLTNLVGGAQAGLGALRAGMTESEKRSAALQTRSDALEQVRMTQEANNALAERQALGVGMQTNAGIEAAGLAAANRLTENDMTNAAAMERTEVQNAGELERANITADTQRFTARLSANTSLRTAALNESGANARAGMTYYLQKQQIDAQTTQNFVKQADDVATNIAARYKFGDPSTVVTPQMLAAMAQEYTRRVLPIAQAYGVPGGVVRNNPFSIAAPPAAATSSPATINRGSTRP